MCRRAVLTMRRLHLLGALTLLLACGPAPASVVPECTHVDGRGGPSADGSAALPYASLDQAIAALGPTGGTICLPAGELDPPTATLVAPLVIRGVSAASTHLSPPPGSGCLAVHGVTTIPPDPAHTQDSDAVIETRADLTLEDLAISDCTIGVRALAGDLTLTRATITHVQAGVLADAEASVVTTDTTITISGMGSVTVPPGGVVSAGARGIRVGGGTDISGRGAAIYSWNVDVDVVGAHLHDIDVGLLCASNAPERMVRVMDTTIERLPATADGGGFNIIWGGSVMIDHVVITDAGHFALVLDGASTTVLSSSFSGVQQLLQAQGGTTALMGTNTFTGGYFALASTPAMLTPGGATGSVHVMGPMTSTGATRGHCYADLGAELVFEVAGTTLSGGPVGMAAFRGGHVEVRSGITISDVAQGIATTGPGSVSTVTGLVVTPLSVGVLNSEGTTTITDAMISGGQHALAVVSGSVTMSGGMIMSTTSSGVRVLAGATMLSGVTIDGSSGPGVSAEGGATTIDALHVANCEQEGLIAEGGAMLDVTASTFDANVGAAIAVYDGTVSVVGSTFLPSRPAAGGRIDHLRIVAATTAATLTLGDGNSFQLGALTCPPDTCSVIMSSGAGANAVVRPNCLTAPDANIIQGLAQDSGTITGTTSWLTVRTSPSVLLGPDGFPSLPMLPAAPIPGTGFSSIAF